MQDTVITCQTVDTLYKAGVGRLFKIPMTNWMAVNFRVGATLIAEQAGIAPQLAAQVPEFVRLLAVARHWHDATFDDIREAARRIASCAKGMGANLRAIRALPAGSGTGSRAAGSSQARALLQEMAASAEAVQDFLQPIHRELIAF
ncbi:MAG TPA: hypothetical protein VIT92_16315, partial [Burkholderiaceae bacterium]